MGVLVVEPIAGACAFWPARVSLSLRGHSYRHFIHPSFETKRPVARNGGLWECEGELRSTTPNDPDTVVGIDDHNVEVWPSSKGCHRPPRISVQLRRT